jgi:lysophospholipase L1-like esterase
MAHWIFALSAALLLGATLEQKPVTIFLAGDSTMARKQPDKKPETGWGEYLEGQFDASRVRVDNRAQNGRSTRTFLAGGLWTSLLGSLHPGDYVFIQFGHNDQPKEKIGSRTTPEEFRANLTRFVMDVRAKSASPVLFTPVVRRRFDDRGKFVDTHFDYPDIVRSVARDLSVPLVDHQRKSERALVELGAEPSRRLFLQLKPGEHANYPKGVEDNTHFSPQGAEAMAKLAVEGIRELKLKLSALLRAQ